MFGNIMKQSFDDGFVIWFSLAVCSPVIGSGRVMFYPFDRTQRFEKAAHKLGTILLEIAEIPYGTFH